MYKKQFGYFDLYPKVSSVALKNTEKLNDSTLLLKLLEPLLNPVKWYTFVSNKKDSQIVVSPILNLVADTNSYKLFSPAYKDTIELRIEYIPSLNGSPSFIGKYKSNEATLTENQISSQDYFFENITSAQNKEVIKILKDSIRLDENFTTEKKVEKIFAYLHKKLFAKRGTPDANTSALNTFKQYEAAAYGNKKIWCGIYAQIFSLFCNNANIKSRFLEIKNDFGNIQGSNHEVSEYFSTEKKQWIAVDLMLNMLQTKNANGDILNTVQVKNTCEKDSTIKVLQVKNDSLIYTNFNNLELAFYDYYGKEKDVYFYTTSAEIYNKNAVAKLKNNIFKNYWFVVYSDVRTVSNLNFYKKILVLTLLFLFGAWSIILLFIKKIKT